MFAFIPALAGLALKAGGAVSAVSSAAGSLSLSGGGNKPNTTDTRERGPRAQQALQNALAGSLPEAQWILQQRIHSATAWSRANYAQAWQQLEQQKPALAAEALKTKIDVVTQGKPDWRERLGDEFERLYGRLRVEAANSAARIAAGTSDSLTEKISGEPGFRQTVPLSRNQLMYIGLALILGIFAVWFFTRRK